MGELIKMRSSTINAEIRELYRSIQQQTMVGGQPSVEPPPSYLSSTRSGSVSQPLSPSKNFAEVERASLQGRNPFTSGINFAGSFSSKPSSSSSQAAFPVHPDVRLKRLPFFDNVAELLRPSSLVPQGNSRYHETNFVFHLTPQQATDIASSRDARPGSKIDFINQIQMRFCLLETSCDQDDNFPSNLSVKVNGKMVTLPNPIPTNKPGVEPKRPPKPVNVTSLCRLSPTVANQINVTWSSDLGGRGYVVAVYIVRRLSSSDLLQRLRVKGVRPAEYTRGLIKDKLCEDADSEIATTSLKVSLVCPLGKMKMQLPCRATSCSHLQCFDASLFLQMNERKPTWLCPVCDKSILYDNLAIDGYFSDILNSPLLPSDSMEVQLNVDGTWTVIMQVKKESAGNGNGSNAEAKTPKQEHNIETVEEGELELVCEAPPTKKKAPMVVDLTLSSSDSEEDDTSLLNIKERLLNLQRASGSQSSRPSTADSVNHPTAGAADLSLASNMISGMSSNSTTSIRPSASAESIPSGVNGAHFGYMSSGSFSNPAYYPYSSSTGDGQNPFHPGYYSSYRATNELQNLLNGSLMNSSAGQSGMPLNSLSSTSRNAPFRQTPSPPDVISLD